MLLRVIIISVINNNGNSNNTNDIDLNVTRAHMPLNTQSDL